MHGKNIWPNLGEKPRICGQFGFMQIKMLKLKACETLCKQKHSRK